jgi:hypothetical protein
MTTAHNVHAIRIPLRLVLHAGVAVLVNVQSVEAEIKQWAVNGN